MQQLAVIKEAGYGLRDIGKPVLFFTAYTKKGIGALQIFLQPKADEIIVEAGVREVQQLNGKTCWVVVDSDTIGFLKMSGI